MDKINLTVRSNFNSRTQQGNASFMRFFCLFLLPAKIHSNTLKVKSVQIFRTYNRNENRQHKVCYTIRILLFAYQILKFHCCWLVAAATRKKSGCSFMSFQYFFFSFSSYEIFVYYIDSCVYVCQRERETVYARLYYYILPVACYSLFWEGGRKKNFRFMFEKL